MGEVVLGVVSSGFAVASLAIQLVEVSQKLYNFWDSFTEADSNVERIKDHLLLIQIISSSIIDVCKKQPHLSCGDAVLKSLQCCKARTAKLEELTQSSGLGSGFIKRNWSSLKLVFKDKTIEKVDSQLKGDVMMLLLTLQPFFHHVHQQDLFSIKEAMKNLVNDQTGSAPVHSGGEDSDTNPLPSSQQISTKDRKAVIFQDQTRRLELFSRYRNHRSAVKLDSVTALHRIFSVLGYSLPAGWRAIIEYYLLSIVYSSMNCSQYHVKEQSILFNRKRRLRVIIPMLSFQIQTSSLPKSITLHPVMACQNQIFTLCESGELDSVRVLFESSQASPFVVNQHGENLLHVAARYAHAEVCNYLLDIGVDGSAYDDRLLTPLDHLARKISMNFAFPSRVVNTIRALVEKGRCQPLLPVTSNAVSFYRGPEEGFAWLFASEYACVDLEEYDSEGWTLLGDAAFNFGWWSRLGIDDPAIGWQALYLLRAGANPHASSHESDLTPLDTFLRGCTRYQVENTSRWMQVLLKGGIDLHKYAKEEQRIHGFEHYLKSAWDEELWKWIPTKRRVVYEYRKSPDQIEIWIEDFDALSWFQCGRFDLEIFQVCSSVESLLRWREMNAHDNVLTITIQECSLPPLPNPGRDRFQVFLQARLLHFLCLSLALNYVMHLFLARNQS